MLNPNNNAKFAPDLFMLATAVSQPLVEESPSSTLVKRQDPTVKRIQDLSLMKLQSAQEHFTKTFNAPSSARDARFVTSAKMFLEVEAIDEALNSLKHIQDKTIREKHIQPIVSALVKKGSCDEALLFAKLLGQKANVASLKLIAEAHLEAHETEKAFTVVKLMKQCRERNILLKKVTEQFEYSGDMRKAAEIDESRQSLRERVTHSRSRVSTTKSAENTYSF